MRNGRESRGLPVMLKALPAIGRVVESVRARDRNLADQLLRAATSVALNLAEADGQHGGHRRSRLHTALGSLRETRTALRVAAAFGYVAEESVVKIDRALDSVTAMTWRRLHPKR